MKGKRIKNEYSYYFADGMKMIVTANDVGREWIDRLYKMNKVEKNKAEY